MDGRRPPDYVPEARRTHLLIREQRSGSSNSCDARGRRVSGFDYHNGPTSRMADRDDAGRMETSPNWRPRRIAPSSAHHLGSNQVERDEYCPRGQIMVQDM